VLIVGGGGGGEYNLGGGGGGGFARSLELSIPQGSTYEYWAGEGGVGGTNGVPATFGQNSNFGQNVAAGGGAGTFFGRGGGSGSSESGDFLGGFPSDVGQGSGGGGGCSGPGGNATTTGSDTVGGNGGPYWDVTAFGATLTCGGGAGCGNVSGIPGTGGGNGCNNVDATSSGGGGGGGDLLARGGNGGRGVVYVKYLSCVAPTENTTTSTTTTTTTEPCFRPTATVTLANGKRTHMKNVKPGDRVLGVNQDGKVVATPMMFVIHMFMNRWAEFVTLKMQGSTLEVTPDHYIYVKGQTHEFKDKLVITAAEAKPGYEMWTYHGSDLILQPILDVNRSRLLGYGNVLTGTGNIIADGVVASVYTDLAGSEEAFHRFVSPARFLHKYAPRFLQFIRRDVEADSKIAEKLLSWRSPTHSPTRLQRFIVKLDSSLRAMIESDLTHDEL
jgi:hypothetical protein